MIAATNPGETLETPAATALDPTAPVAAPSLEPDAAAITGLAQLALLTLRQNGRTDDQIRAYLEPDVADAEFEALQRTDRGYVYAPTADVKREMRRLLVN